MVVIDLNIKTQNPDFIKEFLEVKNSPEKNFEKNIKKGIFIKYHDHCELVEPVPELEDWPGCGDEIDCIDIDFSLKIEEPKLVDEISEWIYKKLGNQEPIPFLEIEGKDTAILKREIKNNLKKHV